MKVLLINPPVRCSPGLNLGTENRAQSYPVGLLYLAAMLEQHGHTAAIIDCGAQPHDDAQLRAAIRAAAPDLLGITATTPSFRSAVHTAQLAKAVRSDLPVVLGGYHPTFFAGEILARVPEVDYVCRGEADYTLTEMTAGEPLEGILGLSYRDPQGEIRHNPDRPVEKDLDVFPFPARHLVAGNHYGSMGGVLQMGHPDRFTTLITSRGCPYSCRYCCVHVLAQRRYRTRSVANVEREVAQLVDRGIDTLYLQDDNFTVNKHLPAICEMLSGYPVRWYCLARVDTPIEHYRRLAQGGCRGIYFGVESFSPRILGFYDKRATQEQAATAIRAAKRAGLDVMVTLILGAPMEDETDLEINRRMITSLDIDAIELNLLTYFPETALWATVPPERRPWDRELLVTELYPEPSLETRTAECEQLKRAFYYRPGYIARQLWRMVLKRPDLLRINLANTAKIIRHLRPAPSPPSAADSAPSRFSDVA